jgi:hypothetical protein
MQEPVYDIWLMLKYYESTSTAYVLAHERDGRHSQDDSPHDS